MKRVSKLLDFCVNYYLKKHPVFSPLLKQRTKIHLSCCSHKTRHCVQSAVVYGPCTQYAPD